MPNDIQNLVNSSGGGSFLNDFSMGSIFVGLMFSIVGMGAWRYGRKMQSARHMLLGIALLAYAYFVPNLWASLAVGSVLTFFLFWPPVRY